MCIWVDHKSLCCVFPLPPFISMFKQPELTIWSDFYPVMEKRVWNQVRGNSVLPSSLWSGLYPIMAKVSSLWNQGGRPYGLHSCWSDFIPGISYKKQKSRWTGHMAYTVVGETAATLRSLQLCAFCQKKTISLPFLQHFLLVPFKVQYWHFLLVQFKVQYWHFLLVPFKVQ